MLMDDPRANTGYSYTNRLSIKNFKKLGHECIAFNYNSGIFAGEWEGCFVIAHDGKDNKNENIKLYGTKEFIIEKYKELNPDILFFHNDFYRQDWFFDLPQEIQEKSIWWIPLDIIRKTSEFDFNYFKKIKNLYFVTKHAADIAGIDNPNIIPHAIDESYFKEHGNKSLNDKFIICRVDRHQPRKQWPYTLHAFSMFSQNKDDVLLLAKCNPKDFCGHDPDTMDFIDLKWFSGQMGIPSNKIKFINNFLSVEEIKSKIYDISSCFITTTGSEGFGLSVVEAMSQGCVPIYPLGSSLTEVVEDNGYPYKYAEIRRTKNLYAEYGRPDVHVVANRMEQAYQDWKNNKDYFIEKSNKCIETVRKKYYPDIIYEKWNNEINKIINRETETGKISNRSIVIEKQNIKTESEFFESYINSDIKISIIIPTYNHLEDCLKPCLESIIKYTNLKNIEVVIVANGCVDNTAEYVRSLNNKNIKLIEFPEAMGYTKSTNEGIKIARGNYIILLNNDTVLLEQENNKWIDILLEPFKTDESVGITGPFMSYCPFSMNEFLIFFCVAIKKEVFDKAGVAGTLDEIYSPGFGEDADFCIKAKEAGYRIVQVPENSPSKLSGTRMIGSFPIYHEGEATFKEYGEKGNEILVKNRLILMNRFGKGRVKLNLGCGDKKLHGYVNVDLYNKNADIIRDIKKMPDILNNVVSEILGVHVFEHISPFEVVDMLKEWYRILMPGGKLILEMPDILETCKNFEKADKNERYRLINCIYGTGMGISNPHLFGWYDEILFDHLAGVGFVDIRKENPQFEHWGHNLRIECIKPLDNLPDGFFNSEDIATYRKLIVDLPDNSTIAEIGVWQGRSLCSIADLIVSKNLNVVAIDHFLGAENEPDNRNTAKIFDLKANFISNIEKFDIDDRVILHDGYSKDIALKFEDGYFDFVFIDATHTYDSIKEDILAWTPKIKENGIIAGHDYLWFDCKRVLDELYGFSYTNEQNIWIKKISNIKPKVYDCFSFFNEIEILKIRLEELYDTVDYFVLVESSKTHSGTSKPLYFKENEKLFDKYSKKIIYKCIDLPDNVDSWARENIQRDSMWEILKDKCLDDDVVVFSDVDEIVSHNAIKAYESRQDICCIEQVLYCHFLNSQAQTPWRHAKICRYRDFKNINSVNLRYYEQGNSPHIIKNGGWHLSYMGGVDAIIKKIESFAHQEYNNDRYKDRESIEKNINSFKDIYMRGDVTYVETKDLSQMPESVIQNIQYFIDNGWINKDLPKITITIPTRNRPKHLKILLDSIIKQNYKNWDLIICNDGNEFDGDIHSVVSKIKENNNVKIIKGVSRGPSFAHDLLWEAAETELIFRIDDDCEMDEHCLFNLVMNVNDKISGIAPLVLPKSKSVIVNGQPPEIKIDDFLSAATVQQHIWTNSDNLIQAQHLHSSFIYRRSLAEKIGGFTYDKDSKSMVSYGEETIFSYKMYKAGYLLYVCQNAKIWHYLAEYGGTRDIQSDYLPSKDADFLVFKKKISEISQQGILV